MGGADKPSGGARHPLRSDQRGGPLRPLHGKPSNLSGSAHETALNVKWTNDAIPEEREGPSSPLASSGNHEASSSAAAAAASSSAATAVAAFAGFEANVKIDVDSLDATGKKVVKAMRKLSESDNLLSLFNMVLPLSFPRASLPFNRTQQAQTEALVNLLARILLKIVASAAPMVTINKKKMFLVKQLEPSAARARGQPLARLAVVVCPLQARAQVPLPLPVLHHLAPLKGNGGTRPSFENFTNRLLVVQEKILQSQFEEIKNMRSTKLVNLEGLTKQDTIDLILQKFGGATRTLNRELADRIYTKTRGRALFVENVAVALRESSLVDVIAGELRLKVLRPNMIFFNLFFFGKRTTRVSPLARSTTCSRPTLRAPFSCSLTRLTSKCSSCSEWRRSSGSISRPWISQPSWKSTPCLHPPPVG